MERKGVLSKREAMEVFGLSSRVLDRARHKHRSAIGFTLSEAKNSKFFFYSNKIDEFIKKGILV